MEIKCGQCGWMREQDTHPLLQLHRCHCPEFTHVGFELEGLPQVKPDDECLLGMNKGDAEKFGVWEGG